jgi:hypothetical protein
MLELGLTAGAAVWAEVVRSSRVSMATPTNLHRERIAAPFSQRRTPRPRNFSFALIPKGPSDREGDAQPLQRREPPKPVQPSYPAAPEVPLDCPDKWRNDMGLFLGRSFRVSFSADGKVYMPRQCYGTDSASGFGGAHQVTPRLGCLVEVVRVCVLPCLVHVCVCVHAHALFSHPPNHTHTHTHTHKHTHTGACEANGWTVVRGAWSRARAGGCAEA